MHTSTHGSQKRVVFFQRCDERDDEHDCHGVYARLRCRLLGQIPAPGKSLPIGALAQELGVSTTPVREALTRLAAQRLIAFTPNKGFFTKTPSQAEIHDLYCLSQVLLEAATSRWPKRTGNFHEYACRDGSSVQRIPAGQVAEHDVRLTAELFVQIASRSDIEEYGWLMKNVNDRLHHARLIECLIIENLRGELTKLIALYTTARRSELRASLKLYHERRIGLVPALCKELLAKSFLARS